MPHAEIGPIAIHLPSRVETNEMLQSQFPQWDLNVIEEKTGIRQRHIAAADETSSDLAVAAAEKLFAEHAINPAQIDFLLLCTQTPDYPLPTTSCLIQDRLGLRTGCGALDFNLGCSGYVYGLALADGLIQSGVAKSVLLLTAETYSKYIDEDDRSLRTIFGDGAAASLITASDSPSLWGFQFGSDGSGGDMLLVGDGGGRPEADAIKPRHRKRWKSRLYMDGPSLINFTVDAVPRLVDDILVANGLTEDSSAEGPREAERRDECLLGGLREISRYENRLDLHRSPSIDWPQRSSGIFSSPQSRCRSGQSYRIAQSRASPTRSRAYHDFMESERGECASVGTPSRRSRGRGFSSDAGDGSPARSAERPERSGSLGQRTRRSSGCHRDRPGSGASRDARPPRSGRRHGARWQGWVPVEDSSGTRIPS